MQHCAVTFSKVLNLAPSLMIITLFMDYQCRIALITVKHMVVRNITTLEDTHSVTFTWVPVANERLNASYAIETHHSNAVAIANTNGGNVSNLTPGSRFNFFIITTIPASADYPEESAWVPVYFIWTRTFFF